MENVDFLVVGAGISGLTTAALLANAGKKVAVWEKNWLPGGCTSSYPRKHYIFESGATTLVGLDDNMPLKYLLDKLNLTIPAMKLDLPMKVCLKDGTWISRYGDLESWIAEAERVFGKKNQRAFWTQCMEIARAVWKISLEQLSFPPSNWADFISLARNFRFSQLKFARYAFISVLDTLKKYELEENQRFVEFVNEQLMITAQNKAPEVNMLFGATALCYTLFGNYYLEGGMIELVKPLVNFIEAKGGKVMLRKGVDKVIPEMGKYKVISKNEEIRANSVIFAIPINNVLEIWEGEKEKKRFQNYLMEASQLQSAFTMGIVAKRTQQYPSLHHQIHLKQPLPYLNSESIFVSMSHEQDKKRCKLDEIVFNISTHVSNPPHTIIENKNQVEVEILRLLHENQLLNPEDLIFYHSSTPKSWEKWTFRKWGFVGGYPQYFHIKPWQMIDARFDHQAAYICGDSTYPGQGIPGATLSGIITFEKMAKDRLL